MTERVETCQINSDEIKTEYPSSNRTRFSLSITVKAENYEELIEELPLTHEWELYSKYTTDLNNALQKHPDISNQIMLTQRQDVTKDLVCAALEVAIPDAKKKLNLPDGEDFVVVNVEVVEQKTVKRYVPDEGVEVDEIGNFKLG